MAINSTSNNSSFDNSVGQMSKTQQRGMDVIQKTLENKNMSDEEKTEIVKAQQQAFGVNDDMLNNTSKTQNSNKSETKKDDIKLSDTQQRGMDVIQKTIENKNLSDEQKAETIQAQQKAFGLSDDMVNNATQKSDTSYGQNQSDSQEPSKLQQIGMKALLNVLSKNIQNNDLTNKDALENIVKTFDLNKELVNQVAENYANDNNDKYILAKQQLGKLMGFSAIG
jgi:hypothetical protein